MHTSSTLTKVNTLNGPIILADHGVTYLEGNRVDHNESLLYLDRCRLYVWVLVESDQIYGGQQCMIYTK